MTTTTLATEFYADYQQVKDAEIFDLEARLAELQRQLAECRQAKEQSLDFYRQIFQHCLTKLSGLSRAELDETLAAASRQIATNGSLPEVATKQEEAETSNAWYDNILEPSDGESSESLKEESPNVRLFVVGDEEETDADWEIEDKAEASENWEDEEETVDGDDDLIEDDDDEWEPTSRELREEWEREDVAQTMERERLAKLPPEENPEKETIKPGENCFMFPKDVESRLVKDRRVLPVVLRKFVEYPSSDDPGVDAAFRQTFTFFGQIMNEVRFTERARAMFEYMTTQGKLRLNLQDYVYEAGITCKEALETAYELSFEINAVVDGLRAEIEADVDKPKWVLWKDLYLTVFRCGEFEERAETKFLDAQEKILDAIRRRAEANKVHSS
ncbi:MAG: hypothetical protein IJO40_07130 [Thermoguttaceae bacterium]|nr:hypothetical protein [Thermoguttaceae bacterium]